MRRVCILDPVALICVSLSGLCLGLIVWGISIGHLGQMVMAGLIGALAAWCAWRLGCEEANAVTIDRGEFWRRNLLCDDAGEASSAPSIARSDTP
jgi:hypothetical protein